jgi:Tol biopolymer transport system component
VAWIDAGNLMVWQTGDTLPRRIASGGVVQPFIAPDGRNIVFTRGAQQLAETLWVVDVAGTAEQQLVGERPVTYTPGENQVGDVLWLDERTVYFNTLKQQAPVYEPVNDLYRVDIITRELSLIAVPSDGGRISISPDKQHIVTVYHGTYGQQDAVIRLMDLLGREDPDNLLFFTGVSTASEFRFYPDVYWSSDSSSVFLAIPDPDLVYSEINGAETAETTLWQIPIDNPSGRGIIGTVQASFFGLPQWSYDGSAMTYLRRTGDSNQFTVYLADGTGNHPVAIFGGNVGDIEAPEWLPASNRFIYAQPIAGGGGTRTYFISGVGLEPVRLSDDPIFRLQFVSDTQYVFITQGNRRLDLRFTEIGGESQFIGSLNTVPVFDAVYVEG